MSRAFALDESNRLTIGNQFLERKMVTQEGSYCVTVSFVNKATGREYSRPGSAEFSFSADGRMLTSVDFSLVRVELHEGDPVHTVAILRSTDHRLQVELHYQAFSDHPVLRKWLIVKNLSDEMTTLAALDWEDINLMVGESESAEVWSDYLTRRDKSITVTMDDCVLLVNDVKYQEGFIVATEAPGPLKRLQVYAQPGRISIGYNRDDETIFERTLAPGEEFKTPAGFFLTFANPIPQDVIDCAYARFVAKHLTVCDVTRVPTITVNTWIPHTTNIDRASLIEQIEIASDLGVDAYQVDDGWSDRMGDWNVDRVKFPNGLEEIAEFTRRKGIRFGLWMAVASAHQESGVVRDHPEWIARDRNGGPNRHPNPSTVTMCLDSDYYDFILEKIKDTIARNGVELLKLDLSTVRNLYEPGMYPGCFAKDHRHRSPRESHVRILERLFELIRTLREKYPRCLIDASYELYGVMDGTDLALTQVADQNWFTNITSPNEVSLRREIFQRGRVTRPWTLNCGGAVLNELNAPSYGLFSGLTAHGVYWGNLAFLDEKARAHYKKWFAWAKRQRAYSDFYPFYQVSNVFPPPEGVSTRDYRHTIPTERYGVPPLGIHPPGFDPAPEQSGGMWDGVARLDVRGEGPIFLFRPGSAWSTTFQLRIPWVDRQGKYKLTEETNERELGDFAGEELIERGIKIEISEAPGARVILLRRSDGE